MIHLTLLILAMHKELQAEGKGGLKVTSPGGATLSTSYPHLIHIIWRRPFVDHRFPDLNTIRLLYS